MIGSGLELKGEPKLTLPTPPHSDTQPLSSWSSRTSVKTVLTLNPRSGPLHPSSKGVKSKESFIPPTFTRDVGKDRDYETIHDRWLVENSWRGNGPTPGGVPFDPFKSVIVDYSNFLSCFLFGTPSLIIYLLNLNLPQFSRLDSEIRG